MNLRRFFYSIGLLLMCAVAPVCSQTVINIVDTDEMSKAKVIENTLFNVQYETSFLSDTLNPERRLQETMLLKTGKKSSLYYSYSKHLLDSVLKADKASGASQDVIQNHLRQYSSFLSYKVYKNYPEGKITFLDQIAGSKFRVEEKMEPQPWVLTEDTLTILSYPCKKAVCIFRGRAYEAWYTPEIPRGEGPWKLHGLPGLILKAQDTQGHYTFECTGIQNAGEDDTILYGDAGYQPVSRQDLNKMYKKYAEDPMGYIKATMPGVNIIVQDESGRTKEKVEGIPFNPMER